MKVEITITSRRAKVAALLAAVLFVSSIAAIAVATVPSFSTVVQPGSMVSTASNIAFTDGTSYFVRDGKIGSIVFSGSNAYSALQYGINVTEAVDGTLLIRKGAYNIGAQTLNISGSGNTINFVGEGKYSTVITYTGTGNALIVDATTASQGGGQLLDFGVTCTSTCTAVRFKDYSVSFVITKWHVQGLLLQSTSSGLVIDPNGGSVIYKNTFEDITVTGTSASGYGINVAAGAYNTFRQIEVTQTLGYAISDGATYSYWSSISTDGEIQAAGQNSYWSDVVIETIFASATPTGETFRLSGYGSSVNGLIITNVAAAKSAYGLSAYNTLMTVNGVRVFGSSSPTFPFSPSGGSSGTCNNIVGLASTSWAFLSASAMSGWFCTGGNLESHGSVSLSTNTTYAVSTGLGLNAIVHWVTLSSSSATCGALGWTYAANVVTITAASACTATIYYDFHV